MNYLKYKYLFKRIGYYFFGEKYYKSFLNSLEQINQGIDLNYGKESQNSDPFLKKFEK